MLFSVHIQKEQPHLLDFESAARPLHYDGLLPLSSSVNAALSTMKVLLLIHAILLRIESLGCPLEQGQNTVWHLHLNSKANLTYFQALTQLV